MTYRDDHDAALARVDALEHENAHLAGEIAKLRSPVPATTELSSRKPAVVLGLGTIAIATAIGVFATSPSSTKPLPPEVHVLHVDLAGCARKLTPSPHYTAETADPHGGYGLKIDRIASTTGCREEITLALDVAILSDRERAALQRWGDAEDRLANEISMIMTYYAGDPYALDGYDSAKQLWREYDRAYESRQVALEEWRHVAR